jgi:nuclear control of ATPase protein 2
MSFVADHCRRIDAQLDRLQLANLPAATSSGTEQRSSIWASGSKEEAPQLSARVLALQASVRALSTGISAHRSLLRPTDIQLAISAVSEHPAASASVVHEEGEEEEVQREPGFERELEWLVVAKATTQVYGLALSRILDQSVALADDVWYWDDVLGSRRYTALYSVQTSPVRLWHWSNTVWDDVKRKGGNFNVRDAGQDAQDSITQRWKQFYGLVRQVIAEKSVAEVQKQALSPVTRIRSEVRRKQAALKKVRLRNANALGVLLGEGLANESTHGEGLATPSTQDVQQKWKVSVARNVALMEAVLAKVNDAETPVDKFDSAIAELTEDDPLYDGDMYDEDGNASIQNISPQAVAERLSRVLALALPQYAESSKLAVQKHGKPGRWTRYWLPITIGILSSSTVLRILVNRKAEIVQWIRELGATTIDFWQNWVVEPTRKVIKTIRHDEGSEVSIMSKRSLEGDRESLERMVIDFAVDNPANATGSNARMTDLEIADLRSKVREGDLTPVLKAYEKDLQSPFMGTIRGNLIRALLIQVQKTKVDVEVAIGGIDSLLKSQELVFGFIGLTPGILITYFLSSYIRSSLTSKQGSKASRKQGKMVRQLRNIDRILTNSEPTEFGELYYKDQGLLLCEAHVLRQEAGKTMPGQVYREFCEDLEEVCNVRTGAERQRKGVERVRWAYGRYF